MKTNSSLMAAVKLLRDIAIDNDLDEVTVAVSAKRDQTNIIFGRNGVLGSSTVSHRELDMTIADLGPWITNNNLAPLPEPERPD